jgi:hypothetical protein
MKQFIVLLGLLILIMLAWQSLVLYPLKLLVVFFHESSHALATLLTGGSVQELVIDPQQGGHVISQGGNRFIILSAGYLGSLAWGALIYLGSVKTAYDKTMMLLLGSTVIIITLVLGRSMFSWLFGVSTGGVMLLMANYWAKHYNDFILRLIGLTSMLYVPLDIYSDTLARSYLPSDAYLLADYMGGMTILWGGIWLLISVLVVFMVLRFSLRQ